MADAPKTFSELAAQLAQHVNDRKAELQAVETQLRALSSAHEDLKKQVMATHEELAAARAELLAVRSNIAKLKDEAKKVAATITSEAQKLASSFGNA